MKTFTIAICILTSTTFLFAQQKIKVKAVTEKMSQGYKQGLSVTIPEAEEREVSKEWKKELKDFGGKISNNKGEIFSDDATIKEISSNTIDIYSIISQNGDNVDLTVFFDLGGAFISAEDNSSQYLKADAIMERFAVSAAKTAVSNQVDIASKELKDLENDHEKLLKDKENLQKNIEQWKKDIEKAQADIKTNEKDQESKKVAIETQSKNIAKLKDKLNAIK